MCNGGCGGCANKCTPTQREIPIKNLHPEQIKQIKNLFVQYAKTADLVLPVAVGTYEIQSIFQAGRLVTVTMSSDSAESTSDITFHFQI